MQVSADGVLDKPLHYGRHLGPGCRFLRIEHAAGASSDDARGLAVQGPGLRVIGNTFRVGIIEDGVHALRQDAEEVREAV